MENRLDKSCGLGLTQRVTRVVIWLSVGRGPFIESTILINILKSAFSKCIYRGVWVIRMGFSAKNINSIFPKFDYLNFMFGYGICVSWYKEVKHSSLYEELVYRPYKNSILWTVGVIRTDFFADFHRPDYPNAPVCCKLLVM